MKKPQRQFSPKRKGSYYLGIGLIAVGFISFISTFFTFIYHFGDFSNFEANVKSGGFRAIGGMVLIIIGVIIHVIGSQGLAGSGVVLDPEQARKDMEPWNRMTGGMIQDALSEVEVVDKLAGRLGHAEAPDEAQAVVKIRCRACQTLNDESARFCNQCAAPL